MENLFVRILEKTLLILGLVSLVFTIGALIYAGAGMYPSLLQPPATATVIVQYQPLNSAASQRQPNSTAAPTVNENPEKSAAIRACGGQNAFVKRLTDGKLDIQRMDDCGRQTLAEALMVAPDRVENYLDAEAAWFNALAADPVLKTAIPHATEDQVEAAMGAQQSRFEKAYSDGVDAGNQRLEDFNMRQEFGKVAAITAGVFAAACFVVFLFIAFLIVAVRVERHLRTMSAISAKFSR